MKYVKERFEKAIEYLPKEVQEEIGRMSIENQSKIQEIRLRIDKQPTITQFGKNYVLSNLQKTNKNSIEETFEKTCGYSIHSHEREINMGYVTIDGGHRIGFCGTKTENGIKDVSSINIRISSEIIGAGADIAKLYEAGNKGVLIAGPPLSGKTTVIRDTARIIGNTQKVSIIDERNEIAAVFGGIPQNNVGNLTDVLTGYGKEKGIEIATKVLSPNIIICDEISSKSEVQEIIRSFGCGVKFIATIHAENIVDMLNKNAVKKMLSLGIFGYVVFLDTGDEIGKVKQIINTEDLIYESRYNADYSSMRLLYR